MAETKAGTEGTAGTTGTGTDESHSKNAQGEMIPKARFDELNERRKAAEEQLTQLQTKIKEQETAEATKRGEFQKLAEQRAKEIEDLKRQQEPMQKDAEAYRAFLKAKRDAAKEVLKDDWLPEYENLSLESLEKVVSKMAGKTRRHVEGGREGSAGAGANKPIWEMTNAEYQAYRAKLLAESQVNR